MLSFVLPLFRYSIYNEYKISSRSTCVRMCIDLRMKLYYTLSKSLVRMIFYQKVRSGMEKPAILCAVDIGGTKLSVALMRRDGSSIDTETVYDHVEKTPDEFVEYIGEKTELLLQRNNLEKSSLGALGVATAGHLNFETGVLTAMSNLNGYTGFPMKDRLEARLGVPVVIDNDANCQAAGELHYGAGRPYKNFIFMTISTQIGAGIVVDGGLFRGHHGSAGEIGHTIVESDSDALCLCGNHGCLISVASSVAFPYTAKKMLKEGLSSSFIGGEGFDFDSIDGKLVEDGMHAGDELCTAIVDEYARYIGIACYNLFQVFDTQCFVLGGGLTFWGERFFSGVRSTFNSLVRHMATEEIAIIPAELGKNSGLMGAAALALDRI